MSHTDESENLLDHLTKRINPNGWRSRNTPTRQSNTKADELKTLSQTGQKGRELEELLHEVARSREPTTVVLGEAESVTIESTSKLKPLPRSDGHAPEGWKDAVW